MCNSLHESTFTTDNIVDNDSSDSYISMNIEPKGSTPPRIIITSGSMNLENKAKAVHITPVLTGTTEIMFKNNFKFYKCSSN